MLLTMKTMCQNTCCNEKRPEPIQEMSGTMFFKARSKFFFGISKKKNHSPFFVTLKMNIKKYFFQKKNSQKNLPTKFVEKICQLKMASGCMPPTMKSTVSWLQFVSRKCKQILRVKLIWPCTNLVIIVVFPGSSYLSVSWFLDPKVIIFHCVFMKDLPFANSALLNGNRVSTRVRVFIYIMWWR